MFTKDLSNYAKNIHLEMPHSNQLDSMKFIHTNGKTICLNLFRCAHLNHLIEEIYNTFFSSQSTHLKQLIVALNFGKSWETINVSAKYGVPDLLKVVVASIESQYTEG